MFITTLRTTTAKLGLRAPSTSAAFSSTSTSFLPRIISPPVGGTSGSSTSRASEPSSDRLIDLVNDMDALGTTDTASTTSLLRNLPTNAFISPGHLSPQHLLTPYLPRPNYDLAYPLGPPVSAASQHDLFKRLELDPRASPMNPWLRGEFCTAMGKIKSRGKTGLQRSSQRKMGKAVRRARSMGVVAVFGQSLPGGSR